MLGDIVVPDFIVVDNTVGAMLSKWRHGIYIWLDLAQIGPAPS